MLPSHRSKAIEPTFSSDDGTPPSSTPPPPAVVASKLNTHLSEMSRSVSEDKILDARKHADVIMPLLHQFPTLQSQISQRQMQLLSDVVNESNHVLDLLRQLNSDDGWILANQKRGTTVHYRPVENSDLYAVRTHTVFDNFGPREFVRLCSLFVEAELMPHWIPRGLLKSNEKLAEPSKYTQICHMKISFGRFVPISCRDSVIEGCGYHLADQNALLIKAKSVEESRHCEVPKPERGYVRMETYGAFYVELLSPTKVLFRQISNDDFKFRYVPTAIINYLAKKGGAPFEIVESIRNVIENFEGSVWEEKMRERRDYYGEIEEKLNKELYTLFGQNYGGVVGDGEDTEEEISSLGDEKKEIMDDELRNNWMSRKGKKIRPYPRAVMPDQPFTKKMSFCESLSGRGRPIAWIAVTFTVVVMTPLAYLQGNMALHFLWLALGYSVLLLATLYSPPKFQMDNERTHAPSSHKLSASSTGSSPKQDRVDLMPPPNKSSIPGTTRTTSSLALSPSSESGRTKSKRTECVPQLRQTHETLQQASLASKPSRRIAAAKSVERASHHQKKRPVAIKQDHSPSKSVFSSSSPSSRALTTASKDSKRRISKLQVRSTKAKLQKAVRRVGKVVTPTRRKKKVTSSDRSCDSAVGTSLTT